MLGRGGGGGGGGAQAPDLLTAVQGLTAHALFEFRGAAPPSPRRSEGTAWRLADATPAQWVPKLLGHGCMTQRSPLRGPIRHVWTDWCLLLVPDMCMGFPLCPLESFPAWDPHPGRLLADKFFFFC